MVKQGISNNAIAKGMIATLVVLTLISFIAVLSPGTITGFTYSEVNASINTATGITMLTSAVDFGAMDISESDDTDDMAPVPLQVRNDGNVLIDIEISGAQYQTVDGNGDVDLWASFPNTTNTVEDQYFTAMCRTDGAAACNGGGWDVGYVWIPTYGNASLSVQEVITNLAFAEAIDSMYIDIGVTVPAEEPPSAGRSAPLLLVSSAS